MNYYFFPRVLAALLAASVGSGLSLSVSAQEASESEAEPEISADAEDQAQEYEPQNRSAPRTSRGVIELESQVTGNREQPQVFYVVPWQSPESPQLPYDPLGSQLEQVFGHLEREELRRELKQREQLQTDADSEPSENQ